MKTKTELPEEPVANEEKPTNKLAQDYILKFFQKKFSDIPSYSHVNAINTYDNRWRVNVYTKEVGFIAKFKIVKSFFVIYDKNKINSNPPVK